MSTQYKKHIIFTGGSSGIGYEATKVLAADPETHIVVLSRSPPKDLPDNVEFHKFDLSDPESVRSCAEWWPYPPADAFVGCAGIGGTPKVTYIQDGIEQTFATNHLGHALLIFLLNDRGAFAPNARISLVGSSLHDPENPSSLKPYWTTADEVAHCKDPRMQPDQVRYPNSKLANTIFSYALASRATASGKQWAVNIFDPGFVPGGGSKLHRNASPLLLFLMNNVIPYMGFVLRWQGVTTSTTLLSGQGLAELVTDPKYANETGKMIRIQTEIQPSKQAIDPNVQDDLWNWTVKFLKLSPKQADV